MEGWVWLTGGVVEKNNQKVILASTYRWKPGEQQWQKMANMNNKRHSHLMTTDGNNLYVIGGSAMWPSCNVRSIEVYNATANRWHIYDYVPPEIIPRGCPLKRWASSSKVIYLPWGKLLLFPGIRSEDSIKKLWATYTIATKSWMENDFKKVLSANAVVGLLHSRPTFNKPNQ